MNHRLELLKKKRIGRMRFENYQKHFKDFCNPIHVSLEDSEKLLRSLDLHNCSDEIVKSTNNFVESNLLRKIYQSLDKMAKSYAFTDDFEYCGVFLVNTKQAIEKSFEIAKKDKNGTFFILDVDRNFYIRINYYDQLDSDYPLSFDVQLCKK